MQAKLVDLLHHCLTPPDHVDYTIGNLFLIRHRTRLAQIGTPPSYSTTFSGHENLREKCSDCHHTTCPFAQSRSLGAPICRQPFTVSPARFAERLETLVRGKHELWGHWECKKENPWWREIQSMFSTVPVSYSYYSCKSEADSQDHLTRVQRRLSAVPERAHPSVEGSGASFACSL